MKIKKTGKGALAQQRKAATGKPLYSVANMANFVKQNAGIERLALEGAVPLCLGIGGVKHLISPAVEDFKGDQFLNGKWVADAIGVVQAVIIGCESPGKIEFFTFKGGRVNHIDTDRVFGDTGRDIVAHLYRINNNSRIAGCNGWFG